MRHEGYTCDGGCGAQLVLDRYGSLIEAGWWTTYPPRGAGGAIETCSVPCLQRALARREPDAGRDVAPPPYPGRTVPIG